MDHAVKLTINGETREFPMGITYKEVVKAVSYTHLDVYKRQAHYRQSVRVVEVLEKNGDGLNLTWETRDGILNHRTSGHPSTLEGQVVRFSDKIAYDARTKPMS